MTTMKKSGEKPGWLEGLMGETSFFRSCVSHGDRRKNEKNVFCLRCCLSICAHCLPSHRTHPRLQVRRYVYHDVVRLGDLHKLIDCSHIQPYTINGAKVVFLAKRAQTRSCKCSANSCFACDRILQEPFLFCSLACKVNHLLFQVGGSLSSVLHDFDESEFTVAQFEGLRMDGSYEVTEEYGEYASNSVQGSPSVMQDKQGSSSSSPRKMNGRDGVFAPGMVLSLGNGNRRKGAPHRAPLF
ncbi:hypothetical protein MLD38_036680 [Melastoma candidum]|uniref:Uncharacterized protein n=1 Tax=Melastoma candidum TaxID=119954 RepID=A0ACB9LKF4_9MYRT|nr:hypothetical protein MLD38_036680 [Melastoma candidum]